MRITCARFCLYIVFVDNRTRRRTRQHSPHVGVGDAGGGGRLSATRRRSTDPPRFKGARRAAQQRGDRAVANRRHVLPDDCEAHGGATMTPPCVTTTTACHVRRRNLDETALARSERRRRLDASHRHPAPESAPRQRVLRRIVRRRGPRADPICALAAAHASRPAGRRAPPPRPPSPTRGCARPPAGRRGGQFVARRRCAPQPLHRCFWPVALSDGPAAPGARHSVPPRFGRAHQRMRAPFAVCIAKAVCGVKLERRGVRSPARADVLRGARAANISLP